jgi:hypothetical protein
MTMRETLEQQMKLEGEDVRRVLIRVLQEEQSRIDMKTPVGIIKAVKTIVIEEVAMEEDS